MSKSEWAVKGLWRWKPIKWLLHHCTIAPLHHCSIAALQHQVIARIPAQVLEKHLPEIEKRLDKKINEWLGKIYAEDHLPEAEKKKLGMTGSPSVTPCAIKALANHCIGLAEKYKNEPGQAEEYRRLCFGPVETMVATLPKLDNKQAVLMQALGIQDHGVVSDGAASSTETLLAQAFASYLHLYVISPEVQAIEQNRDYKKQLFKLFAEGKTPDEIERVLRSNNVTFHYAYYKLHYYYKKFVIDQWRSGASAKNP